MKYHTPGESAKHEHKVKFEMSWSDELWNARSCGLCGTYFTINRINSPYITSKGRRAVGEIILRSLYDCHRKSEAKLRLTTEPCKNSAGMHCLMIPQTPEKERNMEKSYTIDGSLASYKLRLPTITMAFIDLHRSGTIFKCICHFHHTKTALTS